MSETTELIAQQIINGNINKRTWGDILYNVKVYGAKGDVTTIDSIPIQKAIDACFAAGGGIVWFPPGTYLAKFNLKSNVWLYGSGIDVTTLKLPNGENDSVFAAALVNNVKVSDLTVDGNSANQTAGAAVTFYKSRNNNLNRIKVINSYTIGLNMSNVEDTIIDSCIVDGTKVNTAISFSNDDPAYINGNNIITRCTIQNAYLDAIIYNTNNGIITHNKMRSNGIDPATTAGGVYSNGKTGLLISDNIIESNDGNGIDLINVAEAEICNNRLYSNNSAGIMLSGCYRSTITGNICRNNGKLPATAQDDGITIAGANVDITITGNICFDNQATKTQQWGIDVSDTSTGVIVNGNNCNNNVNAEGIRDTSTGTNQIYNNIPFSKSFTSAVSQAFSLAASATYTLLNDNTKIAVIEIVDASLQVNGRFLLRGSNGTVAELEDPINSFEVTDIGTTTAILYVAGAYIVKNRKAATSFYTYKITYI